MITLSKQRRKACAVSETQNGYEKYMKYSSQEYKGVFFYTGGWLSKKDFERIISVIKSTY